MTMAMISPSGREVSPAEQLCRSPRLVPVVVLSLTVEWGVGMERQGPSYGEVVGTKDVRVQALLGRSTSEGAPPGHEGGGAPYPPGRAPCLVGPLLALRWPSSAI